MRTRLTAARDERDQGFTLIELLVVVIIIGILAAIAIPVFLNQRKKGVDASLKSDLKNAALAAETYSTDNPSVSNFDGGAASPTATNIQANFTSGGFKKSPSNTVKVTGGPAGGYQLCAFNSGATTATAAATAMQYNSQSGGLQASTVDCSAATWYQIHP